MQRISFILIFMVLFSPSPLKGEEIKDWRESVFRDSPRLEYLENRLLSRLSTHKIIHTSGERISNPFLFQDDLLFRIEELESQKTKFSLLKEISQIINILKHKERERQLIEDTERIFSAALSSFQGNLDPIANLWLEQERGMLEQELRKITEEKNFYSEILREKLKTTGLDTFQSILAESSTIFLGIKPGFEPEIIQKKLELLEWENNYFSELNKKYPGLTHYIELYFTLPYIFFPFPLSPNHALEIQGLLSEKEKTGFALARLKNLYEKERLSLSFYYAQKKKESLGNILNKITEAAKFSSDFEDLNAIKKLYLDTALAKENLNLEIETLKEDYLRFGNLTGKEESFPFFIPNLQETIKYAQENSLALKIREKEFSVIQKLSADNTGLLRDYLLSLGEYRKSLYEEEKIHLTQEIIRNWYELVFAWAQWENQKKIINLTEEEYKIYLNSAAQTPIEKKLKEIELLNRQERLIEQEKTTALNFLNLKEALKEIEPRKILELPGQKADVKSAADLKSQLKNLISLDPEFKEKEQKLRKNLEDKELQLLANKWGKRTTSDKEAILRGAVELPFIIWISQTKPENVFKPNISQIRNFFNLKESLILEARTKEKIIDSRKVEESEKWLDYLEKRIADDETILNNLKKDLSLDSPQKYIRQQIRILNKKTRLLESEKIYVGELLTELGIKDAPLRPEQEKKLIENLSPILNPERIELLGLEKENEIEAEYADVSVRLEEAGGLSSAYLKNLKLILDFLKESSFKNKLGLINAEDLSEIQQLKDHLLGEMSLLKKEWLSLKKREMPKTEKLELHLSLLDAVKKRHLSVLEENLLKNDPLLKLVDLELKRFASPQEFDLLKYFKKDREKKLKDEAKLLLVSLNSQSRILEIAKEKARTSKGELREALEGLKEEKLWLYGEYGFIAIFLKYLQTQKEWREAFYRLRFDQARLTRLLGPQKQRPQFNYQSIIPPNLIPKGILKNKLLTRIRAPTCRQGRDFTRIYADVSSVISAKICVPIRDWLRLIKESYLYSPLFKKERAKRREVYKMENYGRKLQALNFFLEEKKKEKNLKATSDLFKRAHEKEFRMETYLNQLWEKEKKIREELNNKVKASRIDISQEVSLLIETLNLEEKYPEVLEIFFIQYGKRFGKENFLKKYIENIKFIAQAFSAKAEKAENLPAWWAKYISPVLSYPEKNYLEDIIDLRLLGLYLYYAQLKELLDPESKDFFPLRLKRDSAFLFLDLGKISEDKIEGYLNWESEIRKELDQLTLAKWAREEWEEKRKVLASQSPELLGPLYGSLKDKVWQEQLLAWTVSSGIEEKDYPQFFGLMEKTAQKIEKFFPVIGREEKLSLYEAVRLRYLLPKNQEEFLKEEENKLDEALFQGNILSWSNFFWSEKISLDEVDAFFHFMERLKQEPLFKDVFGQYADLNHPQRRFYLGALSYWAFDWLNEFRQEKDAVRAEVNLKKRLKRFNFIYNLASFQKLYGPVDLSQMTLKGEEEKKKSKEFMGKLGFFVDWTRDFSMDEAETKGFFDDLASLVSLKAYLERFYRNLGLNVKLELQDPRYKEESLGIITSWLQFFRYRGIQGRDSLSQVLDETEFIQKKSQEYNLGLMSDEIRYWWEKIKLKDAQINSIENLFKNIASVRNLTSLAGQGLIQKLNSTPILYWENPELRKDLIEFIQNKVSAPLSRQEIHYFAEKIMPTFDISFEELKNEYAEKLYLEACYFVFNRKEPSPQKLSSLSGIMQEQGYSLWEMGDFIRWEAKLKKDMPILQAKTTELELYGFLNDKFSQPAPYDKKIIAWLNTANILEQYFHIQHRHFLDFSLLKTLINPTLLRYRSWQIRLLVEKGLLSRVSPDKEIQALNNDYLDFKRFILRVSWENAGQILSEKDIGEFFQIYKSIGAETEEKRLPLKKLLEKTSFIYNNLTLLISQGLYEQNLSLKEVFLISEEVAQELVREITSILFQHLVSKQEMVLEKRREDLLNQKRTSPSIIKKAAFPPFEQKKLLEKSTAEKARQTYAIELSTHKLSSLAWKAFEGLSIEEVLKVYVEDAGRIEKLYKEIFQKENLEFSDRQLITYFSEEINFELLSEALLRELFSVTAIIKKEFSEKLKQVISIQEALDYAWPALYSGATQEILESIFSQAKLIRERIEKIMPEEYSPKRLNPVRKPDTPSSDNFSNGINQNILYILSQTYGIQLTDRTEFPYDLEAYNKVLKDGLDYLGIKKVSPVRNINIYGWNRIPTGVRETNLKTIAYKLRISLHPPAAFLLLTKKTEAFYNFMRENMHNGISKEEILVYLDSLQKESLNYLSLAKIFYPSISARINKIKVKRLIDSSFKKFLEKNLNHSVRP